MSRRAGRGPNGPGRGGRPSLPEGSGDQVEGSGLPGVGASGPPVVGAGEHSSAALAAGQFPTHPCPVGGLRVDGLRLEGGIELVHDLSLTLAPGEALGIVGESGSGKSLTLRAIMDLLPRGITRTAGRIEIGGRAGMIFQDPLSSLDPMMTVGRQVAEVCWVRSGASRQASRARVRELFGSVRLPQPEVLATRYPHQLSGGQRQRVLLALALAGDPDILLCDEPTTALDVTVQREVLALLADLRTSRGMSLLFVSHDLAVVSQVCDRVVVLREGRVIEQASTRQIVTAPTEDYTRQLVDAVLPLPALAPIAGAANV